MSSHYVSLNRGEEGFTLTDFNSGSSSTATDLFELRILDGVTPTKVEVHKAIKAFERFFENAGYVATAGFDIKG